ncbi:ATR-interacting protein isoform X1 [Synchiropus splendidus]|uniref:ATR-interacting protein isoform X1 n=1 Tax=Synchiropus splendidus TaxID=270530 RepID=UPI00237DE5D1|nr:ATR-interacting protein isoform X1 [Synchiropus splendidus]
MNYPPTKRLRGLNHEVPKLDAFDDSFGDDGDFTQDDLDEIDIIASQAFTSSSVNGVGSKPGMNGGDPGLGFVHHGGPSKSVGRDNMGVFSGNKRNTELAGQAPGNRQHQSSTGKEDSYSLVEADHAGLKRKLKEVEDEIILKSGEIRVLRDSLKAAQQEKETQRQNHEVLEKQRQKEQNDKEKELNRKVQSLKSELQFKDAEINEMRTKLHSTDKMKTASLLRNSPKVTTTHHGSGSSSSSPSSHSFITKETFGAEVPSRTAPGKSIGKRLRDDKIVSSSKSCEKVDISRSDPFLSIRPANRQPRGSVLLGLMLQQPLLPSSLCLSHLLSTNMADISLSLGRHLVSPCLHPVALHPRAMGAGASRSALSPVQSLAVTGLMMLSHSRVPTGASSRNQRLCPGAVHFLPLLDLHLTRLCRTMDSPTAVGSRSTTAGCSSAAGLDGSYDCGAVCFSVEEAGLAALRLLYLLLAHSDEVVECVLTKRNSVPDRHKTETTAGDLNLNSQNALLQSVLQLCDVGGSSSRQEDLVSSALRILSVLLKRTPPRLNDRLVCVLPVVYACVSVDAKPRTVSEFVSVLTAMSDHPPLALQLCSRHDPCVFLKLFQFVRKRRPDQTLQAELIQLDLQMIQLLSSLTRTSESWIRDSSCQCHAELVQTVVIVFHRQWLDLRGSTEYSGGHSDAGPLWWKASAVSLLRECLLLLHWLLLHHSSFSDSCRSLLHMYDQVIPAVRDTLRKIPDLSESEELALEEVCRSEADDADDAEEEMDTGSA